ncbi:hypothetical protein NEOKW01_0430 [Nematocida sp. AWRm80]|nr:hypothetical protein NEOKW01_0430 [Nematocida sp. AWRm80]
MEQSLTTEPNTLNTLNTMGNSLFKEIRMDILSRNSIQIPLLELFILVIISILISTVVLNSNSKIVKYKSTIYLSIVLMIIIFHLGVYKNSVINSTIIEVYSIIICSWVVIGIYISIYQMYLGYIWYRRVFNRRDSKIGLYKVIIVGIMVIWGIIVPLPVLITISTLDSTIRIVIITISTLITSLLYYKIRNRVSEIEIEKCNNSSIITIVSGVLYTVVLLLYTLLINMIYSTLGYQWTIYIVYLVSITSFIFFIMTQITIYCWLIRQSIDNQ